VKRTLLLAAALFAASTAHAEPASFRLKPGPRSATHSFPVAELGIALRLAGTNATPGDGQSAFVTDHGVLFNASERYAAGLVLHGEFASKRLRLGPTLRVRRWLDPSSAVDVEVGTMIFGDESSGIDFRGPTPFVQASLSAGDFMVVHAQAQAHGVHLRGDYPHVGGLPPTGIDEDFNDLVVHCGVKLGTVPGRAATVVVAIAAGLVAIALSNFQD